MSDVLTPEELNQLARAMSSPYAKGVMVSYRDLAQDPGAARQLLQLVEDEKYDTPMPLAITEIAERNNR